MRAMALAVLLAMGCGGGGEDADLEGDWQGAERALRLEGGRYASVAGDTRDHGRYTVADGALVTTSTCHASSRAMAFEVRGDELRLDGAVYRRVPTAAGVRVDVCR
jgi:hypothetical protein